MPRSIADFIRPSGGWNLDLLENLLPSNIIQVVSLTHTNLEAGHDSTLWSASPDGMFTVKIVVQAINNWMPGSHSPLFKRIWSSPCPEWIRTFIWLLENNALLTNSCRVRCHMTDSDVCPCCSQNSESVLHVIRDCQWAKQVWIQFIPRNSVREFFSSSLLDWLEFNFLSSHDHSSRKDWPLTFGFVSAGIWQRRNAHVF
ncbi:Reverse transcriptase zinc-binding domain [Sesbania bispinosa]|nr:Reverse transcriptase zinc-binding domain [Sesbania bispinosa]